MYRKIVETLKQVVKKTQGDYFTYTTLPRKKLIVRRKK